MLQIFEQLNTTVTPDAECVDTDNGATDTHGFGCTIYTDYPDYPCGGYDDDDFVSGQMCCACNDTGNIPDMFYDINIYS